MWMNSAKKCSQYISTSIPIGQITFDNPHDFKNPENIVPIFELGYVDDKRHVNLKNSMPHNVAAYIFNKNACVLLVKNRYGASREKWSGTGGWVESDDNSPYNAIIREIAEETNNMSRTEWKNKLWVLGIRDIIISKNKTRLYVMYYDNEDTLYEDKTNNEISGWKWEEVKKIIADVQEHRSEYRPFVPKDLLFLRKIIEQFTDRLNLKIETPLDVPTYNKTSVKYIKNTDTFSESITESATTTDIDKSKNTNESLKNENSDNDSNNDSNNDSSDSNNDSDSNGSTTTDSDNTNDSNSEDSTNDDTNDSNENHSDIITESKTESKTECSESGIESCNKVSDSEDNELLTLLKT